jgi:dienelactone hydrolase
MRRRPQLPRWEIALLLIVMGFATTDLPCTGAEDAPVRPVQSLKTPNGVAYGIWGEKPKAPAPTLIILAGTIEGTLGEDYYRRAGNILAEQGFLCVSIDLPCHGAEHRPTEPAQLSGWRYRAEHGEDFVAEFCQRLSGVLDELIAQGYTDPERIAICGTSRGGYLSLQFAAHEPRIRCVAAYAPVTDLVALREFHGAEANTMVQSLDVRKQADKLAGRPVWIIIGDQDERVSTDSAIDLARRITRASLDRKLTSQVDLHVIAEPRGHTTPHGAVEGSAAWLLTHCPVKDTPKQSP